MSYFPPSTKPPPCGQDCWEWVENRNGGRTMAWVWTRSMHSCGHYFDVDAGVWKWSEEAIEARKAKAAEIKAMYGRNHATEGAAL